jgi:hypothetical protein
MRYAITVEIEIDDPALLDCLVRAGRAHDDPGETAREHLAADVEQAIDVALRANHSACRVGAGLAGHVTIAAAVRNPCHTPVLMCVGHEHAEEW